MKIAQEILADLWAAKCWDARYGLPLFPTTNNPWIYFAYLHRVLGRHVIGAFDTKEIYEHFVRCEVTSTPGLFHRWPDMRGGRNSWDEIIGAAYLNEGIARRIFRHLERERGYWNDTAERPPGHRLKFNVYRLAFLRPWLIAACGVRPSLFSQLIWAGHILLSIKPNRKTGDAGGRLRNWIMFEAMRDYPVCQAAIKVWKREMRIAGHTLKSSLEIEPRDSFLTSLAPEEWI